MAKQVHPFVLVIVCLLTVTGRAAADDVSKYDLRPLTEELRKLVEKHYPKGQVVLKDQTILFEFKTRKFMIHEPLLTGEWQDAHEEAGPQKGGIAGELELYPGPYQGMAEVPQTFDKRYFTLLLMAPDSEKLDCHLYVRLKYPRDVPEEFLREFKQLVEGFETQLHAGR